MLAQTFPASYKHYVNYIFYRRVMDLKLIFLAIVIGLYATEAAKERSLGDDDYLPCEYCNLQKEDYPEEG